MDTLEAARSERPKIGHRLTELIDEVLNYDYIKQVPIIRDHLAKMLPYNVIGGKMARGAAVVTSVQRIRDEPLTSKQLVDSRTLGAAIEFLQAHFLVADDIMDAASTRRGQPCWYQVGNNGLGAVNDSILLSTIVFAILNQHFSSHPCCNEIRQLFDHVSFLTDLGQAADILSSYQTGDGEMNWQNFTMKNYSDIVKYKTSYYTTVLPVRAAMYYCNLIDKNVHAQAEDILIRIGHLFQVQDDFLDYYMDSESLGKIATDIPDGKCSWMIVTALSIASPDQSIILKSNYGKKDAQAEAVVKAIYDDLQMPRIFEQYEDEYYTEIMNLIDNWNEKQTGIPRSLFLSVFAPLYKRQK